jgi:hypothetical protein
MRITLRTAPDREADTPHQIVSIWSDRALARHHIKALLKRTDRKKWPPVQTGGH